MMPEQYERSLCEQVLLVEGIQHVEQALAVKLQDEFAACTL